MVFGCFDGHGIFGRLCALAIWLHVETSSYVLACHVLVRGDCQLGVLSVPTDQTVLPAKFRDVNTRSTGINLLAITCTVLLL